MTGSLQGEEAEAIYGFEKARDNMFLGISNQFSADDLTITADNAPGSDYGTAKKQWKPSNATYTPVDGKLIGSVKQTTQKEFENVLSAAQSAFNFWRMMPAPKRGEIVRQFGEELRKNKLALGKLVSYEMGKSLQEGLGEVQEMIDICDFAVGLSRQLYGLTMHSERPGHRMYEQYHPLGVVGIISAFNFPVAVWAWNTALAWICGNVCVWKPSENSPLCFFRESLAEPTVLRSS